MKIKKCIIIRYGELFLKGKNRNVFIQKLISNIILTFQKNDFFSIIKLLIIGSKGFNLKEKLTINLKIKNLTKPIEKKRK